MAGLLIYLAERNQRSVISGVVNGKFTGILALSRIKVNQRAGI
jgi:hypothetical protein